MKKLIIISLIGLLLTALASTYVNNSQQSSPALKTQSQSIQL